MQILLILGIVFAIGAVALFALQNSLPVTVAVASWHFDSSLAIVLLAALGLGALIAGLVSTPRVIKGQWASARLQRQVAILEDDKAALETPHTRTGITDETRILYASSGNGGSPALCRAEGAGDGP